MPISFVAAGAVATGANPTVAVPAGYAINDLLVIITTGTATPTTPTLWTRLGAQGATGFLTILYKFATASESSVSLSMSGTTAKAVMLAYRGASATDTISTFPATSSTSLATTTLTTTYANAYVVSVYGANGGSAANWTAPASTTSRVNSSSTATLTGLLVVDELQAAAGVSTARTATVSATRTLSAVAFAITTGDRYWVGGSATWDATAGTKWSVTSGGAGGAPVPTGSGDVFFNAASGAVTCTLSGARAARSINFTGFTGTFAFGTSTFSVSGNATFGSAMTITGNPPGNLNFIGPACTLVTAGKTIPIDITSASGATLSLGDALTSSFRLVNDGTLTTNNFSVTTGSNIFSNATAGTRVWNLGSSAISCQSFSTGGTTTTVNAGTSTITCTQNQFGYATGTSGTFATVIFSGTNFTCQLAGDIQVTSFSIAAPTTQVIVNLSGNPTIGTLVCSGASVGLRIRMLSSVQGTRRTLTVTTWSTISDIDFRDIGLNSLRSGTRLGNWGNNNNITFVTKTVYWNLAGTQFGSSTGWATTSGGTPNANNLPLAQDTAVFDNAGAAGTITFSASFPIGTLSASARTTAYTLAGAIGLYGNATFGGAVVPNASLSFLARSPQTINSGGITINGAIDKTAISSSLTAASAITSTAGLTMGSNQSFSTAGFAVTFSTITLSGGNFIISTSTVTITGSGAAFTSTPSIAFSGTGTISMTSASAKTFAGGGISYSGMTLNQGGAGTLTITGANTFGNITNSYGATGATSILFTAGTTTTFTDWNANGQAGRLLTIGSVTAASHTLSKASGTVNANFLSISRSNATGGAVWNAGANSIDNGNNTGWLFGNATSASGNFLMFF